MPNFVRKNSMFFLQKYFSTDGNSINIPPSFSKAWEKGVTLKSKIIKRNNLNRLYVEIKLNLDEVN